MTYVETDPSVMTPAELADYQRRTGLAADQPVESSAGLTVPVSFAGDEVDRVKHSSSAAHEDVATWVHEVAVHEASSDVDAQSR